MRFHCCKCSRLFRQCACAETKSAWSCLNPEQGQNSLFLVLGWLAFDAGFRCDNLHTKATAATGRSNGCQFPLAVNMRRSTKRHKPPPTISQSAGYDGLLFIWWQPNVRLHRLRDNGARHEILPFSRSPCARRSWAGVSLSSKSSRV
jgi:hypothetical protein